jgi:hypothetical protein
MSLEALVIYESVLFNRGHMVSRWAEAVERRFVINAKNAAPVRSGELALGIHGEVFRVGPVELETLIFSEAEHTMYVLAGTHDSAPIYPESGKYLSLPAWGPYPARAARFVMGQTANNFFAAAAAKTAISNPSLRGFSPTYAY